MSAHPNIGTREDVRRFNAQKAEREARRPSLWGRLRKFLAAIRNWETP